MPQPKKSYQELRVPFQKMSFSPDVPTAALGPNEYNDGVNVEADVRGVRSVNGDDAVLQSVPGIPTFVTGGFRQPVGDDPRDWYFIAANEAGEWYANNGGGWQDITPVNLTASYTQTQNITEAWSGTVPIFNDDGNAPMFWPEDSTRKSLEITAASGTGTVVTLTFAAQITAPFAPGDTIVVTDMLPTAYNGTFTVSTCSTTQVTYSDNATGALVPAPLNPPPLVSDPFEKMILYSNQNPIDIYTITAPTTNTRLLTFRGLCQTAGTSIAGTTLTVGTMTLPGSNQYAFMAPGMYVTGTGIAAGTRIVRNISGQGDGSTWEVNISQTVAATAVTGYPWNPATTPFVAGELIRLTDVSPRYYNGTWEVTACTNLDVTITCTVTDAHDTNTGTINPAYAWNYNPNWSSVYAKWMRIYNTPNVGSILVAGNLVATNAGTGELEYYPVTVQWSQSFGLNQVPVTWRPTTTNVANQLEVPLRGDALDAFPCNGNLFLCSYWDTVVFSPLNYSTTNTPILGVRLFNQGRGLLTANCWANTDQKVYGVDARDIWVFDGNSFQGIGNQRVKNWFYDQIDPQYYDRIYMEVNTAKNQIEIYYPDSDADAGVPNKMLSYRYDIDCWNAPREVDSATFACEAPLWTAFYVYKNLNQDSTSGSGTNIELSILSGYNSYYYEGDFGQEIVDPGSGYAVGDIITFLGTQLGGVAATNNAVLTVTEVDAQGGFVNGYFGVNGGFNTVGNTPQQHWDYDQARRTVVYARGFSGRTLLNKDQGYDFINGASNTIAPITSYFRKDNIKLLEDYSGKLLVHRILPEVVNITQWGLEIDPVTQYFRIGSVDIVLEGANSVGQPPVQTTALTISTDTDSPWVQIGQNAFRVNRLEVGRTQNRTIWMLTAISFQLTQTEDDR